MNEVPFHDITAIFPMMDAVPFSELVEDIKARGLVDPITMHQGKIIDGRNRYRACKEAGVSPKFEQWHANGCSLTDFVVSRNKHRRHMTIQQLAMAAARALPHYEAEAKERQLAGQRSGGRGRKKPENSSLPGDESFRSDEQVGRSMGVSRNSVARAKKVVQSGSEKLKAAVESNEIPLTTAAKLSELTKSEQNEAIDAGKSAIAAAVCDVTDVPGGESVRKAAKKTTSVRWAQSIRKLSILVCSIAKMSVEKFVSKFTPEDRNASIAELKKIREALDMWIEELEAA